ncbi:MAG: hypothetical protein QW464_03400 [Ignisphaera sp.]
MSSLLNVLALERHSIELEKAASMIVYASSALEQWAQNMNISINLSEYNSNESKKLLFMVFNDSRLALFIGAIQLRALKMFSGEEDYITEEDIEKLLMATLKSSGLSTDNLSCDKTISKLVINLYYGYEMCKYNITDIYNFINLITEKAGEGISINATSKLLSKLLITLMLYNGIITMDESTYKNLLDEMLLYDSIVSAIFLRSYVEFHPINFKPQTSYKVVYNTSKNSNAYLDISTIEKAVYRLIEITRDKNHIKIGDILAAIIIGINYKTEDILQTLAENNISYEESIVIIGRYGNKSDSTKLGLINNEIETEEDSAPSYNTTPYPVNATPIYMGIEFTETQTPLSNKEHRENGSSINKQGIKVDFDIVKESKILTEIVSKSNTAVFAESIPEYNQMQKNLSNTKPIILLSNQKQQYFCCKTQTMTIVVASSTLLLVIIAIFRHNLFRYIKAFLEWSKTKTMVSKGNKHGENDERYASLYRFWATLSLICRRLNITISSFDTHRDVLAKLVDKGHHNVHLIKLATAKYEIIRYSNAWGRKDLEDLNKALDVLENAGDQ